MIQAIPSMYGIFTYIWLFFMVNVGPHIYIYLYIYIHNIPYMDPMGHVNELTSLEEL